MKNYPFLTLSILIIASIALYIFFNKNWTGYYYHAGEDGRMTCEVEKFRTKDQCMSWPNRPEVVNANETFHCGYQCENDSDELGPGDCYNSTCKDPLLVQ